MRRHMTRLNCAGAPIREMLNSGYLFIDMPPSSDSRSVARFGVYAIDLSARRLYKHGIEIRLQEQPFQVLALLLESPGRVVTREELRQQLWPTDTFVAFDGGLNAAVNRLRRVLGDSADNPRFIETIPRQGYRFIAPIAAPASDEELSAPAEQSEDTTPKIPARRWLLNPLTQLTAVMLGAIAIATGVFYSLRHAPIPIGNPEAIQEYQRGRELWRHRTPETLTKAIDEYKKAVALDPSYALAYSGLADAYIVLPLLSMVPQDEAYPKAQEAAAKALALNPLLAEAHTSEADVKLYVDWDFAGAEREFRRALELDSNYATAHQWYAEFLSLMGRHEEAIKEIQRAKELEPFSVIMYHQAGQIFSNARRYDESIAENDRALQINPAFEPSLEGIERALRHKGMYRESIEAQRQFLERNPTFYGTNGAVQVAVEENARAYKTGGKQGFWRHVLASRSRDPRNGRVCYGLAITYGQTGDVANGILWLGRVVQLHYAEALSLKVDPDFDPLRSDPRFQELVKRVGLP